MSVKIEQNKFLCLTNVDFFGYLTSEQVEMFHQLAKPRTYRAGEIIYFAGDANDTLYTLEKGRVKLFYLDVSGRSFTVRMLKAGGLFGALNVTQKEPHCHFAQALTDTALCVITRRDFLEFLQVFPQISLKLVAIMETQLLEIEQKLEDLVFKPALSRIASVLLTLSAEYGKRCACPLSDNWIHLPFKLPHHELAGFVGCTRETVSANLKCLEQWGVIQHCNMGLCESCKMYSRVFIIPNRENLRLVAQNKGYVRNT